MKRLSVFALVAFLATSLLLLVCLQDAPAATPSKVDFPAKDKSITLIVPYPAGGGTDSSARFMANALEKEIGTRVMVLNKPGGAAQVGITQLATSKPDGYTIGYTNLPPAITTYLDPERKAVFSRKNLQPVGSQYHVPYLVAVRADGPYKTLKDLVDAAKANPGKIKAGTTGLLGIGHLSLLKLERAAGIKFAAVHFDGGGPSTTAIVGGHVDVVFQPEVFPFYKSGQIRVLGVMAKEESKFYPGARPLEEQGYNVHSDVLGGISAPAGVPREIVDILTRAIKKVVETKEHQEMMEKLSQLAYYLNPEQFGKYWDDLEAEIKPMMGESRQQ
jgi:tripartite-type tricarboxylate transporter receptor subunit TctC